MGQFDGFYQMPDRRSVYTTQGYRLLDGRPYPRVSMWFDQAEYLNHLTRAALLAMSIDELCEQLIVTRRPESSLAPCCQWLRAAQRARLALQHIEIVFEVE